MFFSISQYNFGSHCCWWKGQWKADLSLWPFRICQCINYGTRLVCGGYFGKWFHLKLKKCLNRCFLLLEMWLNAILWWPTHFLGQQRHRNILQYLLYEWSTSHSNYHSRTNSTPDNSIARNWPSDNLTKNEHHNKHCTHNYNFQSWLDITPTLPKYASNWHSISCLF